MSEAQMATAADIAERLRADLISAGQQSKLKEWQAAIVKEVMTMTMVGDPAQVSQDIGMFQFLRGKYEALGDLLQDHENAAEQLAANNGNTNIAS